MEQETKTITKAIEEMLWHCRFEKKLDEKTIRAYRVDLRQMAETVGATTDIFAMSKADIKQYLQSIAHFKPKTIKRKVATLRSMLNYLECEYENYINPMRKMQIKMKEPIRLPVVMTIEDMRRIFACLYRQIFRYPPGTYSYMATARNIAVIEMLFASGMRGSELCNLRIATLLQEEDVDVRYIQSLLGHSSIATTQIYTHVNLSKQRQILQTKHPRRRI